MTKEGSREWRATLNEVDKMLERAKEATRHGRWMGVEYARFADDMLILVDAHPRHLWLRGAIQRRLREELAKIQVVVNEEKTHVVDLSRGESFGFLGFEFRRLRSRAGKWMPLRTPLPKARLALLQRLRELFRRSRSQPTEGLIKALNPILRGWVQYFAIGHSSRCFSFVRDWVEKKIRRHLNRARLRPGFGWKRWSRQWIYNDLGLFHEYKVRRHSPCPKAAPA
jgi:RNA-directed DNA polymerase